MGFIVNPVAGLGGSVALKGSDGIELQAEALRRGAEPKATARGAAFLQYLRDSFPAAAQQITWFTWADAMGGSIFNQAADKQVWEFEVIGEPCTPSTAADTHTAVKALLECDIDCLVFVGGDGTARDVLEIVGSDLPVVGIPAGVKMHSGVFAVSPRSAAMLMAMLASGELVARSHREVRDYDSERSSDTDMQVRTYGELCVPEAGGFLQQTKIGGKESEPLVLEEICVGLLEALPDSRNIVLGPGSTCLAVKQALGMTGTLRGCDVRLAGGQMLADVGAAELQRLERPLLIVSFTRGQGFLFGRGNQQLSASFLSRLQWPEDVRIIGSRSKLLTLQGRPLWLDTGDDALDRRFSGLLEIITGYQDSLLYRLAGGVL